MQVRKGDVWERVRIEQTPEMIVVYERQVAETMSLIACFVFTVSCFSWYLIQHVRMSHYQNGWLLLIGSLAGLMLLAIGVLYRPGRMLHFFPQERVAERSRRFLWWSFLRQWHDLGEGQLVLRETGLLVKREAGLLTFLLRLFLLLLGPVGIVVAMLLGWVGGIGDEVQATLAVASDNEPDRPLAVFHRIADAQRVVEIFNVRLESRATQ